MAFGGPTSGKGQILTPAAAPSAVAQAISGTVTAIQSLSGAGYSLAASTGLVAAGLGSGSTVFAMRNGPSATKDILIDRISLFYLTTTVFLVPLTSGRGLALVRGSGANTTGGTSITVVKKDTSTAASRVSAASIATTGALTVSGITYESQNVKVMPLGAAGAAGATESAEYVFDAPLILNPGELISIQNPAAFDALGIWQMTVSMEWREA